MNLSNTARKNRTIGEIVNLMSIDVQRFQDMCSFVMLFWSAPLQVQLHRRKRVTDSPGSPIHLFPLASSGSRSSCWTRYSRCYTSIQCLDLGEDEKHAGETAFHVIWKRTVLQVVQMKYKDERLKMMSEILNGMKVLKLYSWEKSMQDQVDDKCSIWGDRVRLRFWRFVRRR